MSHRQDGRRDVPASNVARTFRATGAIWANGLLSARITGRVVVITEQMCNEAGDGLRPLSTSLPVFLSLLTSFSAHVHMLLAIS